MRILVVRLSSMGDVILSSAVLPFLAQRHPHSSLSLVTTHPYDELFYRDPRLEHVFVYEKGEPESLKDSAGRLTWDMVIDLQNNRRSHRLVKRIAPDARRSRVNKLRLRRALLLGLRINTYGPDTSVVGRYLEAAGWKRGSSVPPVPHIELGNDAEPPGDQFARLGSDAPLLGFVPFCAWKNKAWPTARYEQVARHFLQKGWNVVVLGGPHDAGEGLRMEQTLGRGCVSLAGRVSLYRCASVLNHCSLALGNDTGLSHLARAVGVKTAVVYGSTTRPFGFYPYGEPRFRVLESNTVCRPCHAHGGDFCFRFSRPCLGRVEAGRAIRELEELHAER